MSNRNQMVKALTRLKPIVRNQNFGEIATVADEFGLGFLISDEFVGFCRRMKEPSIVIFLTTLAVHNTENTARPQMILEAYQSIANKELTQGILSLKKSNVILESIKAIVEKRDIKPSSEKRAGTGQEWLLAIELSLDNDMLDNALVLMKEELSKNKSHEFILLCSKIIVERATGVSENDRLPWSQWGEIHSCIYIELKKRKLMGVAEKIAQLAGEYCHFAGNYSKSIEWYKKIPTNADGFIISQYQIGRALSHLGEYELSIQCLDKALEGLCHKDSAWINKNFLNADADGDKYGKTKFNGAGATKALIDLQNALGEFEINPFLVSGTLLGYARDRDFLTHDKDIDVGIFAHQDLFSVVEYLNRSGLFTVKYTYLKINQTYQLPIVHKETGMSIDIFVYHTVGDRLITGVQGNYGYVQNFSFTPFKLKKVNFIGVEFSVPENIEENLEENFGLWKIPDANFISHLECPTTVDKGGLIYMIVARLEMLKAIVEGKKNKVVRIGNIILKYQNSNFLIEKKLMGELLNTYGNF